MSRINPEFHRNLWLEFSKHRIIATPVLLTILLFLLTTMGFHDEKLGYMVTTFFLLLMFLWGGHKAAETVLEEINDNTWDFQRLSSQTPWALTWGKLLGCTSYVWYAGAILLAVYVYTVAGAMSFGTLIQSLLIMILGSLVCHTSALLSSLQAARDAMSSRTKLRIINHHVLGLIVGSYCLHATPSDLTTAIRTVTWYGQSFDYINFVICTTLAFFLWLVFGIYWQMRSQLRVRTGPLPWFCFVLYTMFLMAGYNLTLMNVNFATYLAFSTGMALFYFMLLIESWTGITYRQILDNWKQKRMREVVYLFPRWLLTLILAIIAGLIFILFNGSAVPRLAWATGAIIAFAVRDAGIIHYFRFGIAARRPQSTAIMYLIVLYGIIPWLLQALSLHELARLFWPVPDFSTYRETGLSSLSMISGVLQAAFVWHMVSRRWKQYWQVF